MSSNANINAVFYATSYHPIQAGSIDGTDITPHDNGVYRAVLCATTGLYDPSSDPKVIGDPYCTIFVGRLSHSTTEESLKEAMNKYGRVKDLRLVRHIDLQCITFTNSLCKATENCIHCFCIKVTGASQGYAFVEYETEREMRHAYEAAYHSIIDGSEVIVDYSRQQLMSGWIPRRLGGGLGGRKESGQLRFGGRDRPFRAPLRPIPKDELKKLGIPLPPEGRYMSRFQTPPIPRRPSPDVRHHRQSEYRSSGLSRQYGDASETLSDLKVDQETLRKKSSSSRLVDDEQERGVSVAKESTGSFGGGDKAGDREGSMHADTDEGDSKSRSHHHHRHKHRNHTDRHTPNRHERSHTDRHTPHHHERRRKERSSEHKSSLSPDKIDEEKRKRWRHDKYSDYK